MRKTIATKQVRRWQRADRLVFLVPVLIFFYLSIVDRAGWYLWRSIIDEPSPALISSVLIIFIFASLFVSTPIIILWRAVSHSVKKAIIRNASFQTAEDFDYYRDKLTGITPTTISLLMDLHIEPKKDIAALLLKYVKMGAVSIEGGNVRVLNGQLPGLLPSDRTLLDLVARGEVQLLNLGDWRKQAVEEAINGGYLKRRFTGPDWLAGSSNFAKSCVTGCLSGCLVPVLLFFGTAAGVAKILDAGILDKINVFLETAPQNLTLRQQIDFFLAAPDMLANVALASLMLIPMLAALWLPLAALLRLLSNVTHEVKWLKRTGEGELLTAQIAGLKNFLRDYSNLSEVEKEQLALWDDFLIYAVVLEENERIVEDLFSMQNLRYRDFILF